VQTYVWGVRRTRGRDDRYEGCLVGKRENPASKESQKIATKVGDRAFCGKPVLRRTDGGKIYEGAGAAVARARQLQEPAAGEANFFEASEV